jgi:hypothetical protein
VRANNYFYIMGASHTYVPGTANAEWTLSVDEVNRPVAPPAVPAPKIVFGTSKLYTGRQIGLLAQSHGVATGNPSADAIAGANAECTMLANATGRSGTFMAWLSVNGSGPAQRFAQSSGEYLLTTGQVVAQNWSDLTDGTLGSAIPSDERGATLTGGYAAWTGTYFNGQPYSAYTCNDWQSDAAAGLFGMLNISNGSFSHYGTTGCGTPAHMICVQQ